MQNTKPRPLSDTSTFFHAIAGMAIALLVMVGVAGTIYKLVAPGGWFGQLFDRSLAGGMGAILALLVIGLCVFLTQAWVSVTNRNRYSAAFVYVFALAGALYSVELFIGK